MSVQRKNMETKCNKRNNVMVAGILLGCLLLCLGGCGGADAGREQATENSAITRDDSSDHELNETPTGQKKDVIKWSAPEREKLSYAKDFTLDYYDNGCVLIGVSDGSLFLTVPQEWEAIPDEELLSGLEQTMPENVAGSMSSDDGGTAQTVIIRQPLNNIYLVASATMDMFRALDGLDHIRLSGTNAKDWHIEEAREAMEEGRIVYAGKYSAPDYELILSEGCELAIENTMIEHSPEIKENLRSFGIPVLVDHSSYESHPLGRVEWIKLYGVLLGKEKEAESIFEEQEQVLAGVEADLSSEGDGKRPTIAFFYITNNGAANVRKASDYVPKMIELAGGTYIYHDLGDEESHSSSMTMQIEEFYATAKDADYIIYNSAIDGEVHSLEELYAKCGLLADFKAVQEGHVYCTTKNLYQESMSIGNLIRDIHVMIDDEDEEKQMQYLYPVEQGK